MCLHGPITTSSVDPPPTVTAITIFNYNLDLPFKSFLDYKCILTALNESINNLKVI